MFAEEHEKENKLDFFCDTYSLWTEEEPYSLCSADLLLM